MDIVRPPNEIRPADEADDQADHQSPGGRFKENRGFPVCFGFFVK